MGEEVSGGRIFGPFPKGAIPNLQINRMGVVPKGHTPGKWRMITDLSFPDRAIVNDRIDCQLCSLQYTTVDRVACAGSACTSHMSGIPRSLGNTLNGLGSSPCARVWSGFL